MFDDLRSKMTTEEFDYQALMDGLREYDRPRDKITELLRQGGVGQQGSHKELMEQGGDYSDLVNMQSLGNI